jgi:hypothetical protein
MPMPTSPAIEPPARVPSAPPGLPPHGPIDGRPTLAVRVVGALAALTLLLHVVVNVVTPYGPHRDELLYLAMGRHLRFWRMDFPPAIAVLANVERALLGDSLVSIRLAPALAAAALVVLAALIARDLGGGWRAQALAALAVVAAAIAAGLAERQLAWQVVEGGELDRFVGDAAVLTDDFAPVDQLLTPYG